MGGGEGEPVYIFRGRHFLVGVDIFWGGVNTLSGGEFP